MKATSTKEIKLQFQNAINLQQTCKIYLTTFTGESWSFYFKKGYLIWASSSIHRFRRLYRLTNKICPEINCQDIRLREQEISELWEYLLVSVLYQRQLISISQAKQVIQQIVNEVLFDCFIADEQINKIKVIFETKENSMGAILRSPLFKKPIILIEYKKTISQLELLISDWKGLNIDNCSPNLSPVIKDINKLRKTVDLDTYPQLFGLINGKKTIRDLAIVTKQDILSLTKSLIPHLKNKAIALQQIPDRQLANLYFSPTEIDNQAKYQDRERLYIQELDLPLVVCVDHDPHVCQNITQILNPAGYRVLAVNDAAKTLMVLLKTQPALVFLNAAMPDVNGYELCAQMKKMPAIKHIPIIILRKQENLIEGIKAKMSGAADFISKPIKTTELLVLAQKHTQSFIDQDSLVRSQIARD